MGDINMRTCLTLVVLLLPTSASAEFLDGNKLYEWCSKDRSFVGAYAAGVNDKAEADYAAAILSIDEKTASIETMRAAVNMNFGQSCVANGVSIRQISDLVCAYLDFDPANRHKNAASIVTESFRQAWKC